jgi:hypothetical protein
LGIRLWRTWGVVATTCGITTPVLLLHLVGTVEEWSRVRKQEFGVSRKKFFGDSQQALLESASRSPIGNEQLLPGSELR